MAKSRVGGFLYVGGGSFAFAHQDVPLIPDRILRAIARLPFGEVTYTCVPPGSGTCIGIDRDGDGILDREERDTVLD